MGAICNNCKQSCIEGSNSEIFSQKGSDVHESNKLIYSKNYETSDGFVNGNVNGTCIVTTIDNTKRSGRSFYLFI